MEQTKQHGGRREGAGRKKTTAKTIGLRVPEDIAVVLDGIAAEGGNRSEFIVAAIRHYLAATKKPD
ncbi:MAG: ribbon-helix-helix domain-containing protein [Muribaculaceae bacterium]|nr:ribbon-helix-helix domain-containing protein [Muribaculaceae bacterium]